MTSVYIAIIIQSTLSTLLIYNRRKNELYLFHLYCLVICFDFIYELFMYNHFSGSTLYLDVLPSSFRFLKGPILFMISMNFIGKSLSKQTVRLLLFPFFVVFILNIIAFWQLIRFKEVQPLLLQGYDYIFKGYFYYWLGFILLAILQLHRFANRELPFFRHYYIFLTYLAVSVTAYYVSYKAGVDIDKIRHVYNYLFFIQFGLLINLVLRIKNAKEHSILPVVAETIDKYKHSNLTPATMQEIAASIRSFLDQTQDYTSEDYGLFNLAEQVQIPKHQISQVITDHMQTSFYELINTYRLELFLKKLQENPNCNVSDLSFQVGFKSRTTFYKYFKSKLGVTPSEFKEQIKCALP